MAEIRGALNSSGSRFAIVASTFNEVIVDRLVNGALDALERTGADRASIAVVRVPGSFELPVAVQHLVGSGKFDAVIALGCLIRGETPHFDYIAGEVTRGLGQIAIASGVPVTYGVLTVDTVEQAFSRAGLKAGNKGNEAALAAVEMVNVLKRLPR